MGSKVTATIPVNLFIIIARSYLSNLCSLEGPTAIFNTFGPTIIV